MAEETMTSEERLCAAFRLEKPDRVPIVPLTHIEPIAKLAGLTIAQSSNDSQVALAAFLKVFDEYGGWDAPYLVLVMPQQVQASGDGRSDGLMKIRMPGRDLPDDYQYQTIEEEYLKLKDYDKICEIGFDKFYHEDYLWRIADITPQDLPKLTEEATVSGNQLEEELHKRGVQLLVRTSGIHPFSML